MATIEENIRLVVGGHFTVASLGPELHKATLQHMQANAQEYLKKFEEMFLGLAFDAVVQSRLYLPMLLQKLQGQEPAKVRETAGRLLRQYDAVLILYDTAKSRESLLALVPEDTANVIHRLEIKRDELRKLIADSR